jgi:hypothetical protein
MEDQEARQKKKTLLQLGGDRLTDEDMQECELSQRDHQWARLMSVACSGDPSGLFYTSPFRSGCIIDDITGPLSARRLGSISEIALMSYEGNWGYLKDAPRIWP